MKLFLAILLANFSLLLSSAAFSQINPQTDQVIACFQKVRSVTPNDYRFFIAVKSNNVVYFEDSRGQGTEKIISINIIGKDKIIVKHFKGIYQTLTIYFDALQAKWIAEWIEDSQPNNIETYSACKGFKKYIKSEVYAWIKSQHK